jgi:hypothetical protein
VARGPHVVHLDVSCGLTQFSNYTRCATQNALILIHYKFQMHAKKLLVFLRLIFQLNKVEMLFSEIHICMCACEKIDERTMYR